MTALADAVRDGSVPNAKVAVVISDKPNAVGLAKAQERGIETLVIPRAGRSREEHDREMVSALRQRKIDLVCLAGYMRLLSKEFLAAFPQRILNIHPSLLPLFPGLDAQQQAIDHGAKISGCTVHYVDETLDGGQVIAQREVPVHNGDTADSLAERILVQEHTLYPEAVTMVLNKEVFCSEP